VIPFIHKLHALQLLSSAPVLDARTIMSLTRRMEKVRTEEGKCVIAVVGGPGCGKSTLARHVKKEGLICRPPEDFFVIDDLRGPDGERYSKRQVREVVGKIRNKIVLLFDYRAAVYLRDADFCIVLAVDENRRIQNLKNRSSRSYKKYRNSIFKVSPMPLRWKEDVYICREMDLLKCTEKRGTG
jgi:hypothetical protein